MAGTRLPGLRSVAQGVVRLPGVRQWAAAFRACVAAGHLAEVTPAFCYSGL